MRTPLPVSSPKTFVVSNCPEPWQHAYQRNNYLSIDPVVRHGLRSQEMLVWSDEVFAETPDLWQATRTAGLRFGLGNPRGEIPAPSRCYRSPAQHKRSPQPNWKRINSNWLGWPGSPIRACQNISVPISCHLSMPSSPSGTIRIALDGRGQDFREDRGHSPDQRTYREFPHQQCCCQTRHHKPDRCCRTSRTAWTAVRLPSLSHNGLNARYPG